jgi:hypothetical protein
MSRIEALLESVLAAGAQSRSHLLLQALADSLGSDPAAPDSHPASPDCPVDSSSSDTLDATVVEAWRVTQGVPEVHPQFVRVALHQLRKHNVTCAAERVARTTAALRTSSECTPPAAPMRMAVAIYVACVMLVPVPLIPDLADIMHLTC